MECEERRGGQSSLGAHTSQPSLLCLNCGSWAAATAVHGHTAAWSFPATSAGQSSQHVLLPPELDVGRPGLGSDSFALVPFPLN